jgi:glycerol-1-phosphate dehydrogenase [NAD(P)+]
MQVDFPLDIDIFDDATTISKALFTRLGEFNNDFILITGQTASSIYADKILKNSGLKAKFKVSLSTNDIATVYSVERQLRHIRPPIIVAVGGGKVADFGKRLAYIANIPLLLIPTIIANDGLISPIAVLQDEDRTLSLPGRMPDIVLIDLETISNTHVRYLKSAACDLISNISATNDWLRSTGGDSGRIHHLALQMSRMAAHQILNCKDWAHDSPMYLRTIIYGQMLSGIAMALAGSSRPCSGSEHLISHAIDALKLAPNVLHGEKVGIASRFCLDLQKVNDPQLENFFNEFSVAKEFPGCENFSKNEMAVFFSKVREMRPDRTTILDSFSNQELAEHYFNYQNKKGV